MLGLTLGPARNACSMSFPGAYTTVITGLRPVRVSTSPSLTVLSSSGFRRPKPCLIWIPAVSGFFLGSAVLRTPSRNSLYSERNDPAASGSDGRGGVTTATVASCESASTHGR